VSIHTIAGRQALAEDVDDAEFIGRLLASSTDPEFGSISSLGIFTRGMTDFRATLMDTDEDVLFFRVETGTAPDRKGTYPRDAETGELVVLRGSVFVQQLGRNGTPCGPFAVLPVQEFNERFRQAAQAR
jgi:hypothetical protein